MQHAKEPTVGAFFKVRRWNENSLEQLKTELLKAIEEDPQIDDASAVGLELETGGNKVGAIRIVGTVSSDDERTRAGRIVGVNTHDEVEVKNELAVR